MFKGMIVAAAALAVFLLPVFTPDAHASEPRWYVGMSVPVMFLDDSESVTSGYALTGDPRPGMELSPYSANAANSYKAGFKVSGMLGREFGNGFRLQVEGFFASANLSKLTYTGISSPALPQNFNIPDKDIPVSGPADQLGAMVNVWYDFNEGSRWRPFIGGGIGLVQVDWGGVDYMRGALEQSIANEVALTLARQQRGLPAGGSLDPPGFRQGVLASVPNVSVPDLSDTDTVLAFKVGGGLGYELTNHITLQVSYRFFKTRQLEFNGRNAMGNTVKATSDLQGHLFEVGARYRF
jgi:opacity protein-like surface antigen